MTITEQKIAIISDIHLGVHGDSEIWHKIALDYANWLKDELTLKSIKDVFILGDIFNTREEIGVNTLQIAEQFFNILSTFNITLLVGNHDSYLRDNSSIHSLGLLKGWKNITVIDKLTTIETLNKKLTIVPWGESLNNIPKDTDILFGHFEINSFKQTPVKLCEHGLNSEDLIKIAKLTFSGHFHLKEERTYNKSKIIYVGCPYQQTFNDLNSTKGYYIFDIKNFTYEFFENTISPKFYKIKLSELFDKTKILEIKKQICGNFIKIIVDIVIEFEKFEKIINSLMLLKPLELSSDFTKNEEVGIQKDYESVSLDIKSILGEFIETLEVKDIKEDVIKEIEMIYSKALSKVKIEVI